MAPGLTPGLFPNSLQGLIHSNEERETFPTTPAGEMAADSRAIRFILRSMTCFERNKNHSPPLCSHLWCFSKNRSSEQIQDFGVQPG